MFERKRLRKMDKIQLQQYLFPTNNILYCRNIFYIIFLNFLFYFFKLETLKKIKLIFF